MWITFAYTCDRIAHGLNMFFHHPSPNTKAKPNAAIAITCRRGWAAMADASGHACPHNPIELANTASRTRYVRRTGLTLRMTYVYNTQPFSSVTFFFEPETSSTARPHIGACAVECLVSTHLSANQLHRMGSMRSNSGRSSSSNNNDNNNCCWYHGL